MSIKPMSGSSKEKTEFHSGDLRNKVWTFQRFHLAFREPFDTGPVYDTGICKGENCRFMMCLKGKLPIRKSGLEEKEEFLLDAGSCCLQYHPVHCPCLNCEHHYRAQVLELFCPAGDLLPLVYGTQVGWELKRAMNERRPLCIHQPMTSCTRRIFDSLKDVAAKNGGAFVFLGLARALEAVWCFTQACDSMPLAPIQLQIRQAVEKACSILQTNMANPPALENLAAETGMSLSKLKQVFPKVCGVPPYTYLRRIRMERAMKLLAQNGLSVTEAALEVGYSSLSHFTKTFTAHFGIKPSKVAFEKDLSLLSGKYGFNR